MKQKDIFQAEVGGAPRQLVVIISGDTMNEFSDVVIICPLISPPKKYPGGVLVQKTPQNGLSADAEILPFHIRSMPKTALKKKLGEVGEDQIKTLLKNLGDVLAY